MDYNDETLRALRRCHAIEPLTDLSNPALDYERGQREFGSERTDMRNDERHLISWTKEWERDRLTAELARVNRQLDESEPSTTEPLSRRELRDMLQRDRTPKGGA